MSAAAPGAKRLIYIGGYGRSGSTLLGRVFAENEDVLDLGEVIRAARSIGRKKRLCTCGRPMTECPVWGPLREVVAGRTPAEADAPTHAALLTRIAERARAGIIVDSSKTAGGLGSRPQYLRQHLSLSMTLVHLVRDPRAVLWSVLRDATNDGARMSRPAMLWQAARVSASWTRANLACERFRRRHRDGYVRIGYEDALRRGVPLALQGLIGPGSLDRRTLERRDNYHAPAANPMRREKSVVIALDEEWRTRLPHVLRVAVLLLCLPLVARYGLLRRAPERGEPLEATVP